MFLFTSLARTSLSGGQRCKQRHPVSLVPPQHRARHRGGAFLHQVPTTGTNVARAEEEALCNSIPPARERRITGSTLHPTQAGLQPRKPCPTVTGFSPPDTGAGKTCKNQPSTIPHVLALAKDKEPTRMYTEISHQSHSVPPLGRKERNGRSTCIWGNCKNRKKKFPTPEEVENRDKSL